MLRHRGILHHTECSMWRCCNQSACLMCVTPIRSCCLLLPIQPAEISCSRNRKTNPPNSFILRKTKKRKNLFSGSLEQIEELKCRAILYETRTKQQRSQNLFSRSLKFPPSHTHTQTLSLSLSLTHTHTQTLSLSLSHARTHTEEIPSTGTSRVVPIWIIRIPGPGQFEVLWKLHLNLHNDIPHSKCAEFKRFLFVFFCSD